jgi:hypothetical protein
MPWIHLRHRGHDQNYNYMYAENGGGGYLRRNSGAALEWEAFALWAPTPPRGTNAVAFMCWNQQHFVCAEGGGGQHLIADRPWIQGWETFTVRFVPVVRPNRPTKAWDNTSEIVNDDIVSFQAASAHYVTCPSGDDIMRANAWYGTGNPGTVGLNEQFYVTSMGNEARLAYQTWKSPALGGIVEPTV